MTVQDLIEELMELNPEDLVVMAKDSEGNDYSPLSGAESVLYIKESSYSGFIFDTKEEVEDCGEDPNEAIPSVVLFPIN